MKKYTQLVIIRYPASGETIAYRRDDPDLIDTLIDLCNIEYDDTVLCAELEEDIVIEPARTEERAFIESDENPRVPYTKHVDKKILIEMCSMSPRLSNLMCNYGYEYLEDVYDFWISQGDNGLLKMKSFGRKSLNELKDIFAEYDLQMTKQETKDNE